MKAPLGPEDYCGDTQTLVPPMRVRRKRALMPNWQAALQAATLFVSLVSLTMSSIVFMVLLYTPASGPLGQGHAISDLRAVSDLQRQVIIQLQRETSYLDARQKVLQSALEQGGFLTEEVRDKLDGIERALQAKIARSQVDTKSLVSIPEADKSSEEKERKPLIGRPDGHNKRTWDLIGRPDGHEKSLWGLIGRITGHEQTPSDLIGRPDGHEQRGFGEESQEVELDA